MKRETRVRRNPEEHIHIVFGGVAMKNGDAATLGQERRASSPLEPRIIRGPDQGLLVILRLCECLRADLDQQEKQRKLQ
jgi:hypothetical protein